MSEKRSNIMVVFVRLKNMEQARLQVELRDGKGKGYAREVRRAGLIPGVIYGHKQDPINIQFPEAGIRRITRHGGENVLINISITDRDEETVMIKEIQVHPITRHILHTDFVRVSLEEMFTTHVPIILVGEPAGLEDGGILEFPLRELLIECQVGQIPEDIKVDVSALNIGDQIRVEDVSLPEGMTAHDDPATFIVSVAYPTVIEEEDELEAVDVEEMEPELIGERDKEEEEEEEG